MDARLVVVGGKASRSEIKLKVPSLIGRKAGLGVMIDHKSVSRQHCEVFVRDGYLYVKDLNSSNGTFINDQRISESILNPGDALRIGPLTFTAAYIPAPPSTVAGGPGHDAGDALMSDAPIEESDFAGFFDGGVPADGDSFPAPLRNHPRGDALGEGDESDAFGWLGAEASGSFQRPSLSGIAPPELPPVTPHLTSAPLALPDDEPALEDDHTFEDDVIDDLPPPSNQALADEFVAGEPGLEMEELLDADESDSGQANEAKVEAPPSPPVEERSVFASLESSGLDAELIAPDDSPGFLGKFDHDWSQESDGLSDELALGIEPGTTPGDPSSHGDWAVERKTPGEESFSGNDMTVNTADPFADLNLNTPSISLNGETTTSPNSFEDDWSKTTLEPVDQHPLEGLDLAFDEIEQPSVEPRSADEPAPNDASAALAEAAALAADTLPNEAEALTEPALPSEDLTLGEALDFSEAASPLLEAAAETEAAPSAEAASLDDAATLPEAATLDEAAISDEAPALTDTATLPDVAALAAAPPPPDAPPESELEAPQSSDPAAPPQWAPADEEAPLLDLSDDDAPLLEVVGEEEELLELELMDEGADLVEEIADQGDEPLEQNATDVDEELELEVVDESQEAAFDSGASPFDEPKQD